MITCRFFEYEFYDIANDREAIRMEAITNIGTWYTDVEANSRKLRAHRKTFQESAIAYIENGLEPCYIDIEAAGQEIH